MENQLIKKYGKTKLIQILKELQPHLNCKQLELNKANLRKMRFGAAPTSPDSLPPPAQQAPNLSLVSDASQDTTVPPHGRGMDTTPPWYGGARALRETGNRQLKIPGQQRALFVLKEIPLGEDTLITEDRIVPAPKPQELVNLNEFMDAARTTSARFDDSHNNVKKYYEMATGRMIQAGDQWEHLINFWFSCFLEGPHRQLPGLYMVAKLNAAKSDLIFNPVKVPSWGENDGEAFQNNLVPILIRHGANRPTWMKSSEMWDILDTVKDVDQDTLDTEWQEGEAKQIIAYIKTQYGKWENRVRILDIFLGVVYRAFKEKEFAAEHARLPRTNVLPEKATKSPDPVSAACTWREVTGEGTSKLLPWGEGKGLKMLRLICQYLGCITLMVDNSYALRSTGPTDSGQIPLIRDSSLNEASQNVVWKRGIDNMLDHLKTLCTAAHHMRAIRLWGGVLLRPSAVDVEGEDGTWEEHVTEFDAVIHDAASDEENISFTVDLSTTRDVDIKALLDARGGGEQPPSQPATAADAAGRSGGGGGARPGVYRFGKKQKRWVADLKGKKKFVRRQVFSMRKDLVTPSYFEKMTGADFWKLPVAK
tara:strand:+ start:2762 stop:4537 length:1776 start_codon:yes stop_codon:yes gene_type:complete